MIQCDICGKMVRGKTPQWVIDQDLVYNCQVYHCHNIIL